MKLKILLIFAASFLAQASATKRGFGAAVTLSTITPSLDHWNIRRIISCYYKYLNEYNYLGKELKGQLNEIAKEMQNITSQINYKPLSSLSESLKSLGQMIEYFPKDLSSFIKNKEVIDAKEYIKTIKKILDKKEKKIEHNLKEVKEKYSNSLQTNNTIPDFEGKYTKIRANFTIKFNTLAQKIKLCILRFEKFTV